MGTLTNSNGEFNEGAMAELVANWRWLSIVSVSENSSAFSSSEVSRRKPSSGAPTADGIERMEKRRCVCGGRGMALNGSKLGIRERPRGKLVDIGRPENRSPE